MNVLLAMIPSFLWGTTYALTKFTLPDWPPLLLAALRALPAGLLLFCYKPSFPSRSQWKLLLVTGVINIGAFFLFIFMMAQSLPSAISAIGMISVPVFAMLFQWLVQHRRPSQIQLISGSGLITLAYFLFDPQSVSLNPLGLLAMLGAIFCIIIGSTLTKSFGRFIDWRTVLSWQLIIGGLCLAIAAAIDASISPDVYVSAIDHIDLSAGLGVLWLCLMNTVLSYTLYAWLLQRMSVVDFTFGGVANPIAGILLGGWLLNEVFTLFQYGLMLGMIMMSLLPLVTDGFSKSWYKREKKAELL
jgi:drug/metabolite transporter (DMT)-like permease